MSNIAIVTGASRGIGYSTALHLSKENNQVIALARSGDKLKILERESESITSYVVDLTKTTAVRSVVQSIKADYGSVDTIINNAGALVNKKFSSLTDEDWQNMINANLMTAVKLVREALPLLNSNGHIVNMGSMAGFQGSDKFPGLAAYSASKGALTILTECLAAELGEHDIRCNALCLGMVQTEMLNEAFPGIEAPLSADQMGKYIAHFANEGARYYNGQILPVALQDPE